MYAWHFFKCVGIYIVTLIYQLIRLPLVFPASTFSRSIHFNRPEDGFLSSDFSRPSLVPFCYRCYCCIPRVRTLFCYTQLLSKLGRCVQGIGILNLGRGGATTDDLGGKSVDGFF